MSFLSRREKNPKRTGFSTPNGLELLKNATTSAKADNDAFKADPWRPDLRDQGTSWRTAVFSRTEDGKLFMNNVRPVKKGYKGE